MWGGEAWASLTRMRTENCHRLFIPCMSPMARNKLVTALSATLCAYLQCSGLWQAPVLPHCFAYASGPHHLLLDPELSRDMSGDASSVWPGVRWRPPITSKRSLRGFRSLWWFQTCAHCIFLLRIYHTINITTASHGEAILARQELHFWCNILKVCFYGSCKVLIQSYMKCMPAQCFQHSHCGFLSCFLQTMQNDLLNPELYILKFKPCYPNLIL